MRQREAMAILEDRAKRHQPDICVHNCVAAACTKCTRQARLTEYNASQHGPELYDALRGAGEVLEALTMGTIPEGKRYAETCRASERVAAALALVEGGQ